VVNRGLVSDERQAVADAPIAALHDPTIYDQIITRQAT
jgi:hypothetical protein